MRVLSVVVVYNRFDNVEKWVAAWNNADTHPTTLLVVNNYDGHATSLAAQKLIDLKVPVKFRKNDGMDIGALRDTINIRRVENKWDILFWFTDDALPMCKGFMKPFLTPFSSSRVGLVGNHLVPKDHYPGIPEHIRTTCFAIRADVALRLKFPDPLLDKQSCWNFEYGTHNMMEQVKKLGYKVEVAESGKPWYLCNNLVWDHGEINTTVHHDWRRKQDHWDKYQDQFIKSGVSSAAGGRLVPE